MSVILLADDSPHAQRMGQRILAEEGHQVECVSDGEAAALRLPEMDADVVIADAHLPGLSGLDLLKQLRSTPRFQSTKVILATAVANLIPYSERRLADLILTKPFAYHDLSQAVNDLLNRHKQV